MKSKYASVNSEEYRRLYTELMQRLKSLFSQGYTLMTIVGVVWSLAATTLGMFFDNKLLNFSADQVWLSVGLSLVIVVLFGLPTLITFPFAVKQLDNLRSVASLAAYTKAFYEIPSMYSLKSDKKPAFYGWETLHCEAGLSKTKFFNSEYIIAVLLSDILSLCFCIIVGSHIIKTEITGVIISFLIFAFLYEGLLIFLTVHVFRYSRTVRYVQVYMTEYLAIYLQEAIEVGRVTRQQANDYQKYMDMVSKRDAKIPEALKIQMKIIQLDKKIARCSRDETLKQRKRLLEDRKQALLKNKNT